METRGRGPWGLALAHAACGAAIGWALGVAFLGEPAPRIADLILPLETARRFDSAARLVEILSGSLWAWVLAAAGAHLAAWVMTVRRMNRAREGWHDLVLSWVFSLAGFALISLNTLFKNGRPIVSEPGEASLFGVFLGLVSCGTAWWRLAPRHPGTRRRLRRSLLLGGLFGAGLFACSYAFARLFGFALALNVEAWNPHAGPSPRAMAALLASFSVLWAILLPIGFGLAPVLTPEEVPLSERLRRSAVPGLLAAAAALALGAARLYAGAVHDWDVPDLAAAAGISRDAPAPMTVIVLGREAGKPAVKVAAWPLEAEYLASFSYPAGHVPTSEETARSLAKFIAGRGVSSRFRGAAMQAIPAIYSALWDPRRAAACFDGLPTALEGSIPADWHLQREGWLIRRAPGTPADRKLLAALSDDKRHRIEPDSAARLASAWRRLGDRERGEAWLRKAVDLGASPRLVAEAKVKKVRDAYQGSESNAIGRSFEKFVKLGIVVTTTQPTDANGLTGKDYDFALQEIKAGHLNPETGATR